MRSIVATVDFYAHPLFVSVGLAESCVDLSLSVARVLPKFLQVPVHIRIPFADVVDVRFCRFASARGFVRCSHGEEEGVVMVSAKLASVIVSAANAPSEEHSWRDCKRTLSDAPFRSPQWLVIR
jgi:hypothetical protein